MFEIMRIPAFKDNYIWLLRKGASAVVVDPGDAAPVLEVLDREKLSLDSILITHHHKDHQGGVAQLLENSSARVFGPALESITGRPFEEESVYRSHRWARCCRLSQCPVIHLDILPIMVTGACSAAIRCLLVVVDGFSKDHICRCMIL